MRVALLLLLSVGLVACGDTTRKSACSVLDNGDGTRTVRCGDTSVVVPATGDGTTCVKSPSADGGAVIACTDGTTVVLDPDGNVVHRGAGGVVGRVTLAGENDHAGTTVRAAGTEHATVTNEKGDFYLENLDAGVYDLLVERDGWEPIRLRNTIAVGGILYLEPLELRRGRPLVVHEATPIVSPAEDTVLIQDGRELWLHRVDRIDPVQLTANLPLPGEAFWIEGLLPAYAPDGGGVLYLESVDPASRWGRLRRYDVASGVDELVSERAVLGRPLAGGAVLVWRAPADDEVGPIDDADVLVRYPDGAELAVGSASALEDRTRLEPQGRALVLVGDDETVIVDVAARTTLATNGGVTVAAWSPTARKVALALPTPTDETWALATLFLADLDAGTVGILASGAFYYTGLPAEGAVSFSPDGTRVLFVANHERVEGTGDGNAVVGALAVVDTRTLERVLAPDSAYLGWRFSPDGGAVVYQRDRGVLLWWNPARAATTALGTVPVSAIAWSSRGDRLALADTYGTCTLVRIDGDGVPSPYPLSGAGECAKIAFLPDGERTAVVVYGDDAYRHVHLWTGGDLGPSLATIRSSGGVDAGITFASDGSAVLWTEPAGVGQVVKVLGLVDGLAGELPGGSAAARSDFSPDGAFAVVLSGTGDLEVLEVATGTVTRLDGAVVDGTLRRLQLYRAFALYAVDDEEAGRAGWWLAHFPRTPAE